jgi:ankyrin repeat protein
MRTRPDLFRHSIRLARLVPAFAALAIAMPAAAQFSDGYKFLEAVRKGDGDAVIKAVEQAGVTPINTKDRTSGETALLVTVGRKDITWTNYLLAKGARPDLANNDGLTPLMLAVEKRFPEGVELLLRRNANPNQANGRGETPLIRAVQMQDVAMVRLLMANGADPKKRDTLAGMSALDYAERDGRIPGLVDALNAPAASAAPAKPMQGPKL